MNSSNTSTGPIWCSVIITNYNHAAYLAEAINSALAQSYKNIEVIVVDDGSTDTSQEIITSYEPRITTLKKSNGGQASAMNHGFLKSRGDIIIFLDSDDVLLPDTVARVIASWTASTAKVHFRLQQITSDGRRKNGSFVPPHGPLPTGDLRGLIDRFGFYPSPPTSGNAFSRDFLSRVMPIPEAVYRTFADTLLIGAAPLFGTVTALQGIGGLYRRHDKNVSTVGLDGLLRIHRADEEMIRIISTLQETSRNQAQVQARWPQHLKGKLLLQKFGIQPTIPPYGLLTTSYSYIRTVSQWPEYSLGRRILLTCWAVAVTLLPSTMIANIPGFGGGSIQLR